MYAITDYKTKKALREAVKASGDSGLPCYQPGPFGSDVSNGDHTCEGPHYPKQHRWYARVRVVDGQIVKVLG